MRKKALLVAAGAAMATLGAALPALASSHREAPAIALDPAADNTDTWAWVAKGTHDKFYVVAAYNPLEEPSGGPNFHGFSDDVRYEIHIARGKDSLQDEIIYHVNFRTTPVPRVDVGDMGKGPGGGKEFFSQLTGQHAQTYTVTRLERGKNPVVVAKDIPVAPPNFGPRTQAVLKMFGAYNTDKYDDAFAAQFLKPTSEGGRVWAGPRDDGFYVDLGGVFDLANLRAKGTAQDGVSGFNCHAIAIEIPTNKLTADGKAPPNAASDAATLGVWAAASRRQVSIRLRDGRDYAYGPWVQVSRLGLPLINEAVIGVQDKDRFNRSRPAQDLSNFGAYFLNPIVVRDAEAVGIYAALKVDPTPFKANRTDIVDVINLKASGHNIATVGDVLRVDLGLDSGFPNGRPIPYGKAANQEQADVTDVLLSVLLSKGAVAIADGVDRNDKNFLNDMPFLALPWSGYNEGHGKPTP